MNTLGRVILALTLTLPRSAHAQGTLPITKLAPDVYLIVAPSGNMVAETSPSGIVVAGAQSRAATAG